ncbi:hypothetical protein BGW36DRAFT_367975 [Talaromyces proteolyticus]|uniref:DUF7730 domain-containing protein n=1 Tax=Talaromyces proteolyticus TaxID=1131652 RepID=A0AAD4L4C5_9EURO|nr:uncharacterized protein BGW36DRAFT_367975 [Talaromyces proteolyticus]KAH8705668.1 hypothetical protein BGW36DRAFT_367975 [Talaromyces proteolyticus]
MSSLRKWLRRKQPSPKAELEVPENSEVDPLPFLPTKRNPITPSPSTDCLLNIDSYGIFGKLPPEIRRQILIQAFGNRTWHVDLNYIPSQLNIAHQKKQLSRDTYLKNPGLKTDDEESPSWQWFSCECFRWEHWHRGVKYPGHMHLPYGDNCLGGQVCSCGGDGKHVRKPREHSIGIMGWLLSCRMAYQEGMDILFTTNKFHLHKPNLLLNLSRLLPLHRLESIRSVELICYFWDLQLAGQSTDDIIHEFIRTASLFSRVRYMHISLYGYLKPVHRPGEALEVYGLDKIRDLVCALGPGKSEIEICIEKGSWEALVRSHVAFYPKNLRIERDSEMNWRFWKTIDLRFGEKLGFWICSGWEDPGRTFRHKEDEWGDSPEAPPICALLSSLEIDVKHWDHLNR